MLLEDANAATRALQISPTVPDEVAALIDSFDPVLHAEAPLRLEADPYLTTMLFAAALRAEKALRHHNAESRRRESPRALEQFCQALRDIVANRPFAGIRRCEGFWPMPSLRCPCPSGSSLSSPVFRPVNYSGGSLPTAVPAGDDEARIGIVAQLVNQLRHVFTGPGVSLGSTASTRCWV